jgi:hypothetical protein
MKVAVLGPDGTGKHLAMKALHEVKDLIIVSTPPPNPLPLQRIVMKPFCYAYMRSDAPPSPKFFRTRRRKK